ncbi:SDR family oxidoreductase [Ruania alba]|uniref:Meso-butanediol dehydrogenase / (S,S)-butanediol dehydrogenase / diacetyl reductase n=1 Tax=Ruania alba TaxID=648782 RepID=A0A1H5MY72_9MICO|nr:SDR family oxidoreductase [Ruania alba]SEE94294.1 meso-butanediol dehydrogenase / (S,S)-butanediol dehydrogenase / diacetyl reductase [Ruania alba]
MGGRGVLLVGASSEIGRAIAQAFAESGDRVVGVSAEESSASSLTAHLVADCTQPQLAADVVAAARDTLGRLDVIVPAAAVMPMARLTATTDEQWRQGIGATLDSFFYIARAAVPLLGRDAAIVAVSSVNASRMVPGRSVYSAAKGGVEALVRQLAVEHGPAGIRVNAVAPGAVATDAAEDAEGYPLRRVGHPHEVADAVVYLASERASFITGVVLPVDGGLSVSSPAAWLRDDLRAGWVD